MGILFAVSRTIVWIKKAEHRWVGHKHLSTCVVLAFI